VLDLGVVAHVAVVDDGQAYAVPTAYARDGDRVLCHGSTASRLFRTLAAGAPTCLTVTLFDGFVLARSAFESSMHYRSAMVLGACTRLEGPEKLAALRAMSERWVPGRWADVRPRRRRSSRPRSSSRCLSTSGRSRSVPVRRTTTRPTSTCAYGPAYCRCTRRPERPS
jgi:nitroimidazol reductase NimA-like FMN-containing flavoprotein (pyridoxamine 5'-phosphate oxidase superfamily)